MTLTDILVPTYVNLLEALSAWLDKAEAQRPGGAAARLFPIMRSHSPLKNRLRGPRPARAGQRSGECSPARAIIDVA